MTSLLTGRSWLSAERIGADTLRLRDGSLRAVLECTAPAAGLSDVIAALDLPVYAVQIVVRARRPAGAGAAPPLVRLRASYAGLLASLEDRPLPLLDRLLVVVPWDAVEGRAGEAVLKARLSDVRGRLEGALLEPVLVTSPALDALLPPDDVVESSCEVRVHDRYARTLMVRSHPWRLDRSWFLALEAEHDLVVHLRRAGPARMEAGTYLTIWAESAPDLDRATDRAEEILSAHGVVSCRPYLQAEPALVSGLPLCRDLVGPSHWLRARGEPPGGCHPTARPKLLYGVDAWARRPVALDRFGLESPIAVVIGEPRDGRSRLIGLELIRARLAGVEAHVVDPRGEHMRTVAALGGTVIAPAGSGPTPFDPFTVAGGPGALEVHIQALAAVLEILGGDGLPPSAQVEVENALAFAYAARGFADGGGNEGQVPPGLDDVARVLERRAGQATGEIRAALAALARRLADARSSGGARLLEQPVVRQVDRLPVTAYSLAELAEAQRPLATLLSLDLGWSRLAAGRPALVVVDGIDSLLPYELSARFVATLTAGSARLGAGLTLAVSDAAGILGGPLRDVVLGAGMKLLLRQMPQQASVLAGALHLTPAEQSWLLAARPREGLLVRPDRRLALELVASEEEERLITGGMR